MKIEVDECELATILAALRYYHRNGLGDPRMRPSEIHEIATNLGEYECISLDDEGIDKLCEKLNFRD